MKKHIIVAIILCIGSLSALAQTTKLITGTVVDKYGDALPGAIVEVAGGGASTPVDADGSFSIDVPKGVKSLIVKYSGMETKKAKLGNKTDITIKMSPKGTNKGGFINLMGAAVFGNEITSGRVGIMGGYYDTWGGYFKIMPTLSPAEGNPAISAGIVKSIVRPVYLYAGAGYTKVVANYYNWGENEGKCYDGLMIDAGLMIKLSKKFNINIGYSYNKSFGYDSEKEKVINHDIHFGFGYCF